MKFHVILRTLELPQTIIFSVVMLDLFEFIYLDWCSSFRSHPRNKDGEINEMTIFCDRKNKKMVIYCRYLLITSGKCANVLD
jgi:hypothetical protein